MIDLTPLEVRKKKGDFRRQLRGYDPGQVDDFLDVVADRLEQLVREAMAANEKLARLEQQVTDFRDRERAMTDALVTAQEMRDQMRSQVAKEVELAKRQAVQDADHIRSEAVQEREREEDNLVRLRQRQRQLLHSFRAFLERELSELVVFSKALEFDETVPESEAPVRSRRSKARGRSAGRAPHADDLDEDEGSRPPVGATPEDALAAGAAGRALPGGLPAAPAAPTHVTERPEPRAYAPPVVEPPPVEPPPATVANEPPARVADEPPRAAAAPAAPLEPGIAAPSPAPPVPYGDAEPDEAPDAWAQVPSTAQPPDSGSRLDPFGDLLEPDPLDALLAEAPPAIEDTAEEEAGIAPAGSMSSDTLSDVSEEEFGGLFTGWDGPEPVAEAAPIVEPAEDVEEVSDEAFLDDLLLDEAELLLSDEDVLEEPADDTLALEEVGGGAGEAFVLDEGVEEVEAAASPSPGDQPVDLDILSDTDEFAELNLDDFGLPPLPPAPDSSAFGSSGLTLRPLPAEEDAPDVPQERNRDEDDDMFSSLFGKPR